jgi:hypothetical protein
MISESTDRENTRPVTTQARETPKFDLYPKDDEIFDNLIKIRNDMFEGRFQNVINQVRTLTKTG